MKMGSNKALQVTAHKAAPNLNADVGHRKNMIYRRHILCAVALLVNATTIAQPLSDSLQGPETNAATVVVTGHVVNPGVYIHTNGMTLLGAIRAAGGFKRYADQKHVTVAPLQAFRVPQFYSPAESQHTIFRFRNARDMVLIDATRIGKNIVPDPLLLPGAVVAVPPETR